MARKSLTIKLMGQFSQSQRRGGRQRLYGPARCARNTICFQAMTSWVVWRPFVVG